MNNIEGRPVSAKELSFLEPGEKPTFAVRPSYATVNVSEHWSRPLVLLTDRRFVISREKLIGKPKVDFDVGWSEVSGVRGDLWNGGGPQIQLVVGTQRGNVELIVNPEYAVDVESAIRSRYMSTR